jgi:2-polyprenyl-6-methoxyphenol hydroxylase-like FAD-dependent oxidoreductase
MSSPASSASRGHAVVIGTSIAGLLAARVLSDHFQRVTVLDQDELPDSPSPRRGVPQASHLHQVLARGCQIMEQLFPGIVSELESRGALHFDFAEGVVLQTQAVKVPRFQSGIRSVAATRPLLEWSLMRRLRALAPVTVLPGTSALRLHADETGRVRGLIVRQGGSSGAEQVLEADLVVDASGRGSHAPRWLEALGRMAPPEDVIKPGLSYTTRWFRAPEGPHPELGNWVLVATMPDYPHHPYNAALSRVEGGQMLCSLISYGDVAPPDDEAGYLEYARKRAQPHIYDLIRNAEPLSPIHKFRGGINRFRHYEQVSNWPEGFVVMGDAACVFNPAYGQGMTVSGLGALLLGECLKEGQPGACQGFQKRLAQLLQDPWMMVTGGDSLWELGDKVSAVQRLANAVQRQVLDTFFATQEGTRHFYEVMHMLRSPRAMMDSHGLKQLGRGAVKRVGGGAARTQRTA